MCFGVNQQMLKDRVIRQDQVMVCPAIDAAHGQLAVFQQHRARTAREIEAAGVDDPTPVPTPDPLPMRVPEDQDFDPRGEGFKKHGRQVWGLPPIAQDRLHTVGPKQQRRDAVPRTVTVSGHELLMRNVLNDLQPLGHVGVDVRAVRLGEALERVVHRPLHR